MHPSLATYLVQRPDTSPFILPFDMERTLVDLFTRPDWVLPRPYKIFFADETLAPILGFPVAQTTAARDIEQKLDRWLTEEVRWQADRSHPKEKVQQAFSAYVSATIKLAENAMLSNLLADYHGVFWLAHSFDVSRHFAALPRRISGLDTQLGRTQGDGLKYRIFSKWALEMRDQMIRLAGRLSTILDGEEERGTRFFRLLQENVLFLTEEFISPDLRELKSFFTGYLHRDFFVFKEAFERLQNTANDLAKRDPMFRSAVSLFGVNPDQGLPVGLILDQRFQRFIFQHPTIDNLIGREEKEQLTSIARRLQEFSVLHQLRRGIVWVTVSPSEEILPADRRAGVVYSRATRPIDFGRPGVVDPMVYRFGLMYDITSFSETLGETARGGRKGELSSYRQMVLFQRKLTMITARHILQFEKFLGDGAFYTTRRAFRLIQAAVEIQKFYSEMRSRGFTFNKGLRIALNYGYYRLLPMKGTPDSTEYVVEFYGPGVVELSRLTTGKATKEIEEIQGFLIAHGYDSMSVHKFFAPLARGVDVVDHKMHQREFYAYVNANGHLVNEGIVGSMQFLQELSAELMAEASRLYRLKASWGTYSGFAVALEGIDFVGIRSIGLVSLKGLDKIEVVEVVRFRRNEVEVTPADDGESLYSLVRQEAHQTTVVDDSTALLDDTSVRAGREKRPAPELLICEAEDEVTQAMTILIGEWDARSDELRRSIRLAAEELETLFAIPAPLDRLELDLKKREVQEFYLKATEMSEPLTVPLEDLRRQPNFSAFLVGSTVEKL